MTDIPVLETERLILRGFRREDFDAYAAMWADPEVIRYIGGQRRTEEDSWLRFHMNLGFWTALGVGCWAIEEKATGDIVGQVGFMKNKRGLRPDISMYYEMGWALVGDSAGKGFGKESSVRALEWADKTLDEPTLGCIVHPDNLPSLRLAARLGFEGLATTLYHGDATLVMLRKGPRYPEN